MGSGYLVLGYLWIFPLGEGHYHIGVGGIGLVEHEALLEQYYTDASARFSFTPICGCRGYVRVASPHYSTPLYQYRRRSDGTTQQIIGIGESIGTVSPFTGEGIVYALECARLLADSLGSPEVYARSVLSRFDWMKKERETLDYLLSPEGKRGPRLQDRWRFYQNAHRSRIGLPMWEAFKTDGELIPVGAAVLIRYSLKKPGIVVRMGNIPTKKHPARKTRQDDSTGHPHVRGWKTSRSHPGREGGSTVRLRGGIGLPVIP
jgi:Dehydrogenases (flavoproteins)